MKKTLTLIALLGIALFPASGAESNQHWAVGVSESGGWYDADKTFNGDKDLCWAAAASNVIAWWQDQNPELAKAAAAFQAELAPLMQAKGADIRLDCAELAYVSSIGLRLFLLLQKSVSANGGTLVLTGLNPQVKQVFDITGFSKIIRIQ